MSFSHPIPILRILEEGAARAFYVDYLGFKVQWEHRFEPDFPIYLKISREDCVLHLTAHTGDCPPGARLRIPCGDVQDLFLELSGKVYPAGKPKIEHPPWGGEEITLTDPFSNKLTFFMEIDS